MTGLFSENYKVLIFTVMLVLGLFVAGVVLKPIIIGYSTYNKIKNSDYSIEDYAKNVKQLESSLIAANANLSLCSEFNKKLLSEFDSSIGKYSECKTELGNLKVNGTVASKEYEYNLKNLNSEIVDLGKALENLKQQRAEEIKKLQDETEKEISDLKSQYDLLARNTANNMCCKAKIDNPKINYYNVENNRVVCAESGQFAISC